MEGIQQSHSSKELGNGFTKQKLLTLYILNTPVLKLPTTNMTRPWLLGTCKLLVYITPLRQAISWTRLYVCLASVTC